MRTYIPIPMDGGVQLRSSGPGFRKETDPGREIAGQGHAMPLFEYCLRYHASISNVDFVAFAARSPVLGCQ